MEQGLSVGCRAGGGDSCCCMQLILWLPLLLLSLVTVGGRGPGVPGCAWGGAGWGCAHQSLGWVG